MCLIRLPDNTGRYKVFDYKDKKMNFKCENEEFF